MQDWHRVTIAYASLEIADLEMPVYKRSFDGREGWGNRYDEASARRWRSSSAAIE